MKNMIKVITKEVAIVLITVLVWFTIMAVVNGLISFYEMKVGLDQLNGGDFGYLMAKSAATIRNFVQYTFGIITAVILINSGLKIHDTYEMLKSAKAPEGENK